jgi:hypothetical protein
VGYDHHSLLVPKQVALKPHVGLVVGIQVEKVTTASQIKSSDVWI